MSKWTLLGRVVSSTYRQKLMYCLDEGQKTPKQLAKESGINFSHISNVLRQLQEIGVVECLTPELRKGRIYRLTKKGKKLVKEYL